MALPSSRIGRWDLAPYAYFVAVGHLEWPRYRFRIIGLQFMVL